MYIVINKTRNDSVNIEGNWPTTLTDELIEQGEEIIVISFYSKTIKTPVIIDGKVDSWKDFPFPKNLSTIILPSSIE